MCIRVTSRPEQNTKAAGILQRLSGDQGHKTDSTVHRGSARVDLQVTHKVFILLPSDDNYLENLPRSWSF